MSRRAWLVTPVAAACCAIFIGYAPGQETAQVRVGPGQLQAPRPLAPQTPSPSPDREESLPRPGLPQPPPAETAPPVPSAETAPGPDDRAMWAAIGRRDPAAARREITRLEAAFRSWRPPGDALGLIAEQEFDARLQRDRQSRQWQDIAAAGRSQPEQLSCARVDHVWAVADAELALHHPDRVAALYADVIERCTDPAALRTTLQRAVDTLPAETVGLLVSRAEARRVAHPGDIAELRYRIAVRRLNELAAHDSPIPPDVTATVSEGAPRYRDAGAALQLGWVRFHAGDAGAAQAWFERARAWGAGSSAVVGLVRVLLQQRQFDEADWLLARLREGPEKRSLQRGLHGARAGEALRHGDSATALREVAAARGLGATDSGTALIEGYALLDQKRLVEAGAVFQSLGKSGDPSAVLGLARVRLAEQKFDEAERLADAVPPSDERQTLLGDIALARVSGAYDSGDFPQSLRLVESAPRTDANKAGLDTIEAWSLYHIGEPGRAAPIFEKLYRADPQPGLAQGLYLSLAQAQPERIPELSATLGGPFSAQAVAGSADAAFSRKDFVTAQALAPERYPLLAGVNGSTAYGAAQWRSKSGAAGLDRLSEVDATGASEFSQDRSRFALSGTIIHLDAGSAGPRALIGTPNLPAVARPTHALSAGFEPRLSWDRAGEWELFGALGLTPIGGVVGPLPDGNLGARRFQPDGGWWRLEAFVEPKRESILSYTGIVDPATGKGFGRVIETGARGDVLRPLGGAWTATAHAAFSKLTGQSIISNDHARVGFGLGYDLRLGGFDYFVVGPAYDFDAYRRNTLFFTAGHGGYFSPQTFHRAGLATSFLSKEQRDITVRGRLELGYDVKRQAAAQVLPLADNGLRFAGSQGRTPSANGELEAAWRVSDRVELGGRFMGNVGGDYQEAVVGLFLRYSFDPRPAAVSRDLSPFPLRR